MHITENDLVKITWAPESQYEHTEPRAPDAQFYSKCIVGNLILSQDDHVLVLNDDCRSDLDEECDVAQILHMYESLDPFSNEDPCRAIVRWYSRPKNIKKYSRGVKLDQDREIVLDYRPFDDDISLETISKKCFVSDERVDATISFKSSKMSIYVCRYKLVKQSAKYILVPLVEIDDDHGPKTPKTSKTPKKSAASSKKKIELSPSKRKLVSPIKITKNGVERMSRNSDEENVTPNKRRMTEINGNYLEATPKSSPSFGNERFGARRNLNDSLNIESPDSDILNYSIVKTPNKSKDINICLRISQRHRTPKLNDDFDYSPSVRKRSKLADSPNRNEPSTPTSKIRTRRSSTFEPTVSTPTTKQLAKRRTSVHTPQPIMHPRRSILKTPNKTGVETPKKRLTLSNIVEEVNTEGKITRTPRRNCKTTSSGYYCEPSPTTPPEKSTTRTPKKGVTPKHGTTPNSKMKQIRSGEITPSIHNRAKPVAGRRSELEKARESLHVSAVVKSLPCRENEFNNVYSFLEGKLFDKCGGCMYISGVPGTGKTATVTQVIKSLRLSAENDDVHDFEFIEINGMRLTEPRQAYVQIYKQLTGKTLVWEQAHNLLEKRFTTPSPRRVTTVLLVDELDILCNRRQDVVYNLLDWPSKATAKLVVITIANTMDLPERLLMGKVASRLGLTRLTFYPYSHKQLQEIVTSRLTGNKAFESDAIQLVARKVASVSGDARRALDICRRATEIAELDAKENNKAQLVTMSHVQRAVEEMIASVKVKAIKSLSKLEQLFLQAVGAEVTRTGIEETSFLGVYSQFEAIVSISGLRIPSPTRTLQLCSKLGSCRLLICEHSRTDIYMKILLNVSVDDIHYALQAEI